MIAVTQEDGIATARIDNAQVARVLIAWLRTQAPVFKDADEFSVEFGAEIKIAAAISNRYRKLVWKYNYDDNYDANLVVEGKVVATIQGKSFPDILAWAKELGYYERPDDEPIKMTVRHADFN